jgi:hypothetical protein
MKLRSLKLPGAVGWMLIGAASTSVAFWSLGKGGSAQTNWVTAAVNDVLPAAAVAAPPDSPVPGGRGGMTPAQRRQRMSMLEYLRQRTLNPSDMEAEQNLLQENERAEWNSFLGFAAINAPNLTARLGRLGQNDPTRVGLMQRWLNMEQLQENKQTELYDLDVEQFKHEDVVRGLTQQVATATRNRRPGRVTQLTQQLKAEMEVLVGINLNQRALQIENAQKLLDEAKTKLQLDQTNKQKLVEEKTNDILQKVKNAFVARNGTLPADPPQLDTPALNAPPPDTTAPPAP